MLKLQTLLYIIIFLVSQRTMAQYVLQGRVLTVDGRAPLPGAVLSFNNAQFSTATNSKGEFSVTVTKAGVYAVQISFIGYETKRDSITVPQTQYKTFMLTSESIAVSEVQISKRVNRMQSTREPLAAEILKGDYIVENNSGNLVKSIEKMPGVSAMDIGSGASKPMIRGMAFNRVAVTENGIKQENQQWGADHGLEIDQYSVERLVVYKGPMSLQYGSDAMGGVLAIETATVPDSNKTIVDAMLLGKSNNDLLGLSILLGAKRGNWFAKCRYSQQNFGDYRIPTDSIVFLTRRLPIYNRRLKNTAGSENMVSTMLNYSNKLISNTVTFSNVYQKNGFFPGSHGIPDLQRVADDGNSRNVDFPFSQVNHFKLINNTIVRTERMHWHTDLGFQDNHRQEWAAFHTHYSNQKQPSSNPDLELDFVLKTLALQSRVELAKDSVFSHCVGLAADYQQNTVGGYNFLLPNYNRSSAGLFIIENYQVTEKTKFTGGLRVDVARIKIAALHDTVLETFLRNTHAFSEAEIMKFAQRSYPINRQYGMMSGSLGVVTRITPQHTFKANFGRSFRLPGANELSSNGVHHGSFRHEQGDTALRPEIGYQCDASFIIEKQRYSIAISPFMNWFSNYIYLNPTGEWSILPHAGQVYRYSQAEALIAGGECSVNYRIMPKLEYETSAEYVYMQNLTDGYPLPFSPPLGVLHSLSWLIEPKHSIHKINLKAEQQFTAAQDRIARNEELTAGYMLLNLSAHDSFHLGKTKLSIQLMVQNVLNARYYNHLSFYRKLSIPEAGRNIQLSIRCNLL